TTPLRSKDAYRREQVKLSSRRSGEVTGAWHLGFAREEPPRLFPIPCPRPHRIEMSCLVVEDRTEHSSLEQAGRYSLRPRSNCPISVKSDHGQSDYCQPSPSVLHSIGCQGPVC